MFGVRGPAFQLSSFDSDTDAERDEDGSRHILHCSPHSRPPKPSRRVVKQEDVADPPSRSYRVEEDTQERDL
jgi:hypothetical protein